MYAPCNMMVCDNLLCLCIARVTHNQGELLYIFTWVFAAGLGLDLRRFEVHAPCPPAGRANFALPGQHKALRCGFSGTNETAHITGECVCHLEEFDSAVCDKVSGLALPNLEPPKFWQTGDGPGRWTSGWLAMRCGWYMPSLLGSAEVFGLARLHQPKPLHKDPKHQPGIRRPCVRTRLVQVSDTDVIHPCRLRPAAG